MKKVTYTKAAAKFLRVNKSEADRVMEKVSRYAKTNAGDVKMLKGSTLLRLRVGDFRVIFEETENTLTVLTIGHRSDIYE